MTVSETTRRRWAIAGYRHPLEPAIRTLKQLEQKTGNAEAQRDLRFAVGLMEDHAGNDLAATPALERLEQKGAAVIEARDKLAEVLGLEGDAHMLDVLRAAYKALETLTAALELQTEEVAA